MPYSGGSYSSLAYSASPTGFAADGEGIPAGAPDTVQLGFVCDAEVRAASDFGNGMQVTLGFECDAFLVGGTGTTPTRPEDWDPESPIKAVWVPENPVTGS